MGGWLLVTGFLRCCGEQPVVNHLIGDVAQEGERLPCTEEVRGSSPLISTKFKDEALDKILFLVYNIIHKRVKRRGYEHKRRPEK